MADTIHTLASFGIPSGVSVEDGEIRTILAHLVDAGAILLGELQTARDIIRKSCCADERAYLLISAIFLALHSGDASLALTGDAKTDSAILANAGRIDRRTDELSADADGFSNLVTKHWPSAVATAQSLGRFIVSSPSSHHSSLVTHHSSLVTHHSSLVTHHLFFSRYYDATIRVRDILSSRHTSDPQSVQPPNLHPYYSYSRCNFELTSEQENAVESAVANRFAVITGGPGTGKTTIVCSILRALIRLENLTAGDIALAAPTGRAAQRMGEALRKQCMAADDAEITPPERALLNSLSGTTIHTLLGGLAPRWRHNAENPLPHKLVIIDESSMVDLLLMRSLLEALRDDCRLVLLGDANQLPPVEAGAVLGSLVGAGSDVVSLTQSRRFTGSLRQCAEEFNRGELAAIMSPSSRFPESIAAAVHDPATKNSCMWHEPGDARTEIDSFLREWADSHGLGKGGEVVALAEKISPADDAFRGIMTPAAKALFDALDASRILSVVRNGPFGVVRANENLLRHRLGHLPRERRLIAPGIPVIVTINTPALGLFNGDVGITVKGGAEMFALFPRGERVVACPVSRLPDHEIAYAITVHKSQGSEFGNVLVVLPDTPGHPLLTRRMVYTAVTRARLRAVIFSSRQALESSSENLTAPLAESRPK